LAKKKVKNYKQRLKDAFLEKIKNCTSHARGRRLINQGILNKTIDLSDGMNLMKTIPPKPNVKVKILDPNAPLHGIIIRKTGMEKIQLTINKDGTWSNEDITVTKTGITLLNEEGTALIFVSDDEEVSDAWQDGAKTMAAFIVDVADL